MASTNFSNHFLGLTVTQTRLFTSATLFGTCGSWMFLSFMVVQAFTYFRHYNNDPKFLKSIVYVVIMLQLVQTALESYEAYVFDSLGWGDPTIVFNLSAAIADDLRPIFESLTAFIVQCFFTWRIWTFSTTFTILPRSNIRLIAGLVCTFIALVSALSLGAALIIAITSLTVDEAPWWYSTIVMVWNASSAVADIVITICMMALLLHAKASAHSGKTRDLLSHLSQIVLQTGLLTSILALLVLPLLLRNLVGVFTLPWYILGKSEVISLLANLNARKCSNTPMVHGSSIIQAAPATKLSTLAFTPANRPTIMRVGFSDSTVTSFAVCSVVQMNGQDGSIIHRAITEEPDQDIEEKLNAQMDESHSILQANV